MIAIASDLIKKIGKWIPAESALIEGVEKTNIVMVNL